MSKSKVMRCRKEGADAGRMNIVLEREKLEKVDCFKYHGSTISCDGKIEKEDMSSVNEVAKVHGGLNELLKCKMQRMDAMKKL